MKIQTKCQYPDCDHVGNLITKMHYRMAHSMEKEEVVSLYGEALPLSVGKNLGKNQAMNKNSDIWTLANTRKGKSKFVDCTRRLNV